MKKKIIVLALCVLMVSGCGSKIPKLANGDEAVVTLKDGMTIGTGDLYLGMKDQYGMDTLINMVDKKILEEKYSGKVEEAKSSTESYMNQLKQSYGDQLEQAIQYYTNYNSVEAFQEAQYIDTLRSYAIEDYCKGKITDKEIEAYYKDEVVGDIKVSHILITANVNDSMTDAEKEAAKTEAKEKVEAIISELRKTNKDEIAEKFAELAKEQSEDQSTSSNGGSLGFINKDTLSDSYKELVNAAYKLNDGEFTTSVVTTSIGYHVVLRTETKEKASLDEVKDTIIDKLAEKYLEENPESNVKALQDVRKQYDMEIIDTDIQSQYATYIQKEITNYQNQKAQSNQ